MFGANEYPDWPALAAERELADRDILEWAGQSAVRLARIDARVPRGVGQPPAAVPAWIAATHPLQPRHPITAGTTLMSRWHVDPGVTDLPYLPGVVRIID